MEVLYLSRITPDSFPLYELTERFQIQSYKLNQVSYIKV